MRVLDEVSFASAEQAPRAVRRGDHCAAIVEDYDDAARVACPFIGAGLLAGERVLSWVPAEVGKRIQHALPAEDLARLQMVDSAEVYKAPFDAATAIEAAVALSHEPGSAPLRVVGGPMGDPTIVAPAEEWARYEHLAHAACVEHGITALCLWEAPTTPPDILEIVRTLHGLIDRDAAMRRNPDFVWAG